MENRDYDSARRTAASGDSRLLDDQGVRLLQLRELQLRSEIAKLELAIEISERELEHIEDVLDTDPGSEVSG